ncbi:hypothetical protein ABEB36_010126 [Hypothenemus hampei]|uniref:Uncharacterized protein n=1 Tax=Hypothenemus hampei TaxID=57062 RepID=A0ABD1ELJ9_HYPHA
MDFYKKVAKNRDSANLINEKEYKCAGLEAIIGEALKENNQKCLKELVEEANGHLNDLKMFKTMGGKQEEKCEQLIKRFEACLVRIAKNESDILEPLNGQLQELQELTNTALNKKDTGELRKLTERMNRNIGIIREIPEVKKGDAKLMAVLHKYTSLLDEVTSYLNQMTSLPQSTDNKVSLNEVEEKIKFMRQKRLDRLSTFVNEQTKLAEQRTFSSETFGLEQVKSSALKPEILVSKREIPMQSFAEKHIERARNNTTETTLKQSNSSKVTPIGTPTPIRKIFHSFNCAQKSNTKEGNEDNSDDEFINPFTRELKNFSFKNTKVIKQENNITTPTPVALKRTLKPVRGLKPLQTNTDNTPTEQKRSSLPSPPTPPPPYTIVIKRDSTNSNNSKNLNRHSFTTFRDQDDEIEQKEEKKEKHTITAVENPLYDTVGFKLSESEFATLMRKSRKNSNRIHQLEPDITKLEYVITLYRGLKRDPDYLELDKALTKFYVKVNKISTEDGSMEMIEKGLLMARLNKAHQDLKKRVEKNEEIMKNIFLESVLMIAKIHGIA